MTVRLLGADVNTGGLPGVVEQRVQSLAQTLVDIGVSAEATARQLAIATLTKASVGLDAVNNTSDADKPVSTAQAAINAAKADLVAGKVPTSQIAAISTHETIPVDDTAARKALTSTQIQPGDEAIVATGTSAQKGRWLLLASDPSQDASWLRLSAPGGVQSVNGQTIPDVVLGPADVGAPAVADLAAEVIRAKAAEQTLTDGKASKMALLYGTGAQRLALNPATLPNPTIYISTDEAASLRIFVANGVTWSPGASASTHAERHIPGGADPLAWATIHGSGTLAARPAASATNFNLFYFATDDNGGTLSQSNGLTWVPIAAAVSVTNLIGSAEQQSHRNQPDGYPGLTNGRLDQRQIPGYFSEENIPLAAAAVLTTNPRAVTGATQVTYSALGDQPFTLTVETSTDGVTFTSLTGSSSPSVAFGTRQIAAFTTVPTTAYVRCVITNGAAAQTALSSFCQVTNLLALPAPGTIIDSHLAGSIAQAKITGLPNALSTLSAGVAAAYVLPAGGIPQSTLTAALQTKIDNAAAGNLGLIPAWAANTSYASGQLAQSPVGAYVAGTRSLIQAQSAFTSGSTYNASNWLQLSDIAPSSLVGGDLAGSLPNPTLAKIQGTSVDTPTGGATAFLNAAGKWTAPAGTSGANTSPAAGLGYFGWTNDPSSAGAASAPTSGRVYLLRARAVLTGPCGRFGYATVAAGSGFTAGSNLFGIYDTGQATAGIATLLGQTGDQASNLGVANNAVAAALSSTVNVTAGQDYFLAMLITATTMPTIMRQAASSPNFSNVGLTGIGQRITRHSTSGQTSLPATIAAASMASNPNDAFPWSFVAAPAA